MRGFESGCGLSIKRSARNVRPANSPASVSPRPRLAGHAQGVVEQPEAIGQIGEGDAQRARLLDVPRRADAEPGAAAGQHVERRRRLDPEPGCAIRDGTDHQPQARALRVAGHEAERGHALEHRLLELAHAADLEQVVHDPDRVEAGIVGRAADARQGRADLGVAAGPGE